MAYGVSMLYAGSRAYDLREFLGLPPAAGCDRPETMHFRRQGILGRLRHPWYSGGIALMLGLGETPGHPPGVSGCRRPVTVRSAA